MTTFENIIICESENNFDGQKGTVRSAWCVFFYLHTDLALLLESEIHIFVQLVISLICSLLFLLGHVMFLISPL